MKHGLGSVNFDTWLKMQALFREKTGMKDTRLRSVELDVPYTSSVQLVSAELECKSVYLAAFMSACVFVDCVWMST